MPCRLDDATAVEVGNEVVVVHGSIAHALGPAGARLWFMFDGEASLDDIAQVITERDGVDPTTTAGDVVAFARAVGYLGLLTGVQPPARDVTLIPLPQPQPGDIIDGLENYTTVENGAAITLPDLFGCELLVVAWSSHCGYCAAIGAPLAELVGGLDQSGIRVVFACSGDPETNRSQVEALGLNIPVFCQPHPGGPLAGYGTPAAVHLRPDGRLGSPIVSGAHNVLTVARRLAGITESPDPPGVRYLLAPDGGCAAPSSPGPSVRWTDVRVYDVDGYRFGLRVDSETTGEALDALFRGNRVDDPRAGHSYAVALPDRHQEPTTGVRELNLLVRGATVLARSRSTTRILRSLLWRLADEMVSFDPDGPTVRVNSMAVMVDGVAMLVPPGVRVLAPGLSRQLARAGIAVADVPRPEIDLLAGELVLRSPAVTHDPRVLADDPVDEGLEARELLAGRYPLAAWGTVYPAAEPVTLFTAGQAAAALASNVWDPYDFPELIGRLGPLFEQVQGFGIWYESEAGLLDAIVSAAEQIQRGGQPERSR